MLLIGLAVHLVYKTFCCNNYKTALGVWPDL